MTTQKDLKRLVRARMRKTGESYTAARAQILARRKKGAAAAPTAEVRTSTARKKAKKAPARSAKTPAAATAGMSDESVSSKTGKTWAQWCAVLDRAGAREWPHRDIARWLAQEQEVPSWWSQMVTVGYERLIGRRVAGQKSDGSFSVSKSKTVPVSIEDAWKAFGRCQNWLGADHAELRMSKATRLKTMRMKWSDGSPIQVLFAAKGDAKTQIALQHDRLADEAAVERWKAYWGTALQAFARYATQAE